MARAKASEAIVLVKPVLNMMYNTQLKEVKEHNYLGVWINEKLLWKTHISYICNKANRTLGFLHRNLRTCPTHLKEQACKQLPHLGPSPYNRGKYA